MDNLDKNKYYIGLSMLKSISTKEKNILLQKNKNPRNIFFKTEEELIRDLDFAKEKRKERIIKEINNINYSNILNYKIELMKKSKVNLLTINDENYPTNLKRIYDPPICIYYKGNIELLNKKNKIAIIGCRKYSEYGKNVSIHFSYKLAQKGIVIVSGCARGIDSFAHKGCILANRETIAVLGNGLDYIYPPENKKLEEQIVNRNGILITEYIIGTKPNKYTFPARNRLISALSEGILVIEAKLKSGTLITVDFALEQGKNIYVIPGNITQVNSKGTNELIKQGAKLVTEITDILDDIKCL